MIGGRIGGMPDEHPGSTSADYTSIRISRSDRRRRTVRQMLFVVAGAHTGGFVGSAVPRFGLPGDLFSLLLIVGLFTLPFVVDANWERIEAIYEQIGGTLE